MSDTGLSFIDNRESNAGILVNGLFALVLILAVPPMYRALGASIPPAGIGDSMVLGIAAGVICAAGVWLVLTADGIRRRV